MAEKKKKSFVYGDPVKKAEQAASGKGSKAFRIPDGMSYYSPKKAGVARLIIAPFICGGKNNPYSEEGKVWYERTYYVHKNIGPDDDTFLCARKSLGKKCPICDFLVKAKSIPSTNPDLLKELEPKDRQLFIVKDLDEPAKGWRIFDMSFHLFGKALDAKVKTADAEDAHYRKFFYPNGGSIIKIGWEQRSYKTATFYEAKSIDIRLRTKETDLGEAILEEMPCLDDLLVETPYEKLAKLFKQGKLMAGSEEEEADDEENENEEAEDEGEEAEESEGDDDDSSDSDDESGDDSEDNSESDAEDEEEDVSDDDDADTEGSPFSKGDLVVFEYRGKKLKGKVVKVVEERGILHVDTGEERPNVVRWDECKAAPKKKPVIMDDDEDDIAPKKKPPVKSKSRAFTEEAEDDEDFGIDDEDDTPPPPKKKLKK